MPTVLSIDPGKTCGLARLLTMRLLNLLTWLVVALGLGLNLGAGDISGGVGWFAVALCLYQLHRYRRVLRALGIDPMDVDVYLRRGREWRIPQSALYPKREAA